MTMFRAPLRPVWMQATRRSSDDKPGTIEIDWGHWKKRMFLRPHAVISTRKASIGPSQPTIKLPDGRSLRAGIGERPSRRSRQPPTIRTLTRTTSKSL